MDATAKSPKNRHYCTVCSNYRGKMQNNRSVTLHRFPMNDKIRTAWIRRIKLVKKGYKYNDTQRLCSEHFVDGMFERHVVPSVFGEKIFQTNRVEDIAIAPVGEPECLPMKPIACPIDADEYAVVQENFRTSFSAEESSVHLHDYCGPVTETSVSKAVNKSEQTDVPATRAATNDSSTQTKKMLSDACTQTELFNNFTTDIKKQTTDAETQCNRPVYTYEDVKSDQKCMFYTGIPSKKLFETLFDEMKDAQEQTTRSEHSSGGSSGRPRSLRLIDEFFLVLMRLRLGLLLEDIADRFCISKSTCGVICDKWINYLHVKLAFLTCWQSRAVVDKFMPNKFKRKYPNCRVIIDCTELFTETPQSLKNKSLLYSSYKSHMTYKALLGISPSGNISFASDLWSGGISDKQITKRSGILDLCEAGDAIMADKGFLISDLTTPIGVDLIIPPFKTKRFTRREVEETRRIANLRIDVERAMERVKNFRILRGDIPITLAHCVSKLWKICVHLSNLQPPLVQDDMQED